MTAWLRNGPSWCDGFNVQEDHPIPGTDKSGKERIGRSRKKPDIIVFYTIRPRVDYWFEAKLLKKAGNSGEYTTQQGMGRFITGDYSPTYDEAAMLGYASVESIEYWHDFIKKEIDGKQIELSLIPPQEDVQVVDSIRYEWGSGHNRNSINKAIKILHILLDCRP